MFRLKNSKAGFAIRASENAPERVEIAKMGTSRDATGGPFLRGEGREITMIETRGLKPHNEAHEGQVLLGVG